MTKCVYHGFFENFRHQCRFAECGLLKIHLRGTSAGKKPCQNTDQDDVKHDVEPNLLGIISDPKFKTSELFSSIIDQNLIQKSPAYFAKNKQYVQIYTVLALSQSRH